MKLCLLLLLSVHAYHCCTGYPVVEGELSTKFLVEDEATVESFLNAYTDTDSNDTSSADIDNFDKKLGNGVEENRKAVKDKAKHDSVDVKDFGFENETAIEYMSDSSNQTSFNNSSPQEMHGYGKKVVEKVKDGIKTVKDKVKGGIDKVKNKIKDFKDKIGSKGGSKGGSGGGSKGGSGGGSGGGYYRDKYDRDYDRDRYNRDYDRDRYDRDYYRKDRDYSGGSGVSDPNAKWIGLGIGIVFFVGIIGLLVYFKVKGDF